MSETRLNTPEQLNSETGEHLYNEVHRGWRKGVTALVLDLEQTRDIDSPGGAWLLKIAGYVRSKGGKFNWEGQREEIRDFMDMFAPALRMKPVLPPKGPGLLDRVTNGCIDFWGESCEFATLCLDTIYWIGIAPFEGKGLRLNAIMDEAYEMGVRAIRIVFLMNFLLGLIIAMLSAKQVEAFGMQIYVADLIMIGFARELAAVMTAVVVSARTGAAIAAELATMKVQEEIDALRGMGINIVQYLVSPKVLALVIVLPCLSTIGLVSGIAGGAVWGVIVLGFRPAIWYQQTLGAAFMGDLIQGFLKTLFFALAIALIGCHNGLRVSGGSRGVGLVTTRAVVMDIFTMICIDILFAIFFYYLFG
ncbi:MAG: ABC transporter permease [Candidatus Hydrogenedentes bacterium]|nr:ABC transporter permease [Candidatus Hydrogenedentota bacterium]